MPYHKGLDLNFSVVFYSAEVVVIIVIGFTVCFFNSLSPEIQNSESIRLFGKRLNKVPSFLIKYTLCRATYFKLLSFPFIFKTMHFIFHAVLIIRMMYPTLLGSL